MDIQHSIKQYKAQAAFWLNNLEEVGADIGSILVNTQDLLKRARTGFVSERVNMKSTADGVSALNEAMPTIEIACLHIQLKANEILLKVCNAEDTPDSSITVVVQNSNLEDTLPQQRG